MRTASSCTRLKDRDFRPDAVVSGMTRRLSRVRGLLIAAGRWPIERGGRRPRGRGIRSIPGSRSPPWPRCGAVRRSVRRCRRFVGASSGRVLVGLLAAAEGHRGSADAGRWTLPPCGVGGLPGAGPPVPHALDRAGYAASAVGPAGHGWPPQDRSLAPVPGAGAAHPASRVRLAGTRGGRHRRLGPLHSRVRRNDLEARRADSLHADVGPRRGAAAPPAAPAARRCGFQRRCSHGSASPGLPMARTPSSHPSRSTTSRSPSALGSTTPGRSGRSRSTAGVTRTTPEPGGGIPAAERSLARHASMASPSRRRARSAGTTAPTGGPTASSSATASRR